MPESDCLAVNSQPKSRDLQGIETHKLSKVIDTDKLEVHLR
ncbi:unnamed protein product [Moneuplotes crassus]|uniref:Uncharacterized protein n=1 Tax=Euplotes crassus TaxID=5936 RepID=A0AAD2D1X6_EUPCR|nr:unnamed protein product [Moneuplotes crassus]